MNGASLIHDVELRAGNTSEDVTLRWAKEIWDGP